jgi:glycosyltransferase involved in cell wall biosynthesis
MLALLARSRPLADAIGRQGRRYVRGAYSWKTVGEKWMQALADVARSASAADAPIPRT